MVAAALMRALLPCLIWVVGSLDRCWWSLSSHHSWSVIWPAIRSALSYKHTPQNFDSDLTITDTHSNVLVYAMLYDAKSSTQP